MGRPGTCILLRQRARAVPQGQWTRRLLPVPFNPASTWSISPGPIFLEDSESVSTTFFILLLHGLFLSFAFCFVSMCPCVVLDKHISFYGFLFLWHMCVNVHNQQEEYHQPADWKMLTKKNFQEEQQSAQEELTPFPSSPARNFCLTL